MNKNFTVSESPARKVTVTISSKQLWQNYVTCWMDITWWDGADNDDKFNLTGFKDVAKALCKKNCKETNESPWGDNSILKLFRDGLAPMLLGDSIDSFFPESKDEPPILREVIVQILNDSTGEVKDSVTITHEDIQF